MSYNPVSDFLALLRNTAGGVRAESMPGLDFVVSAMARAGLFTLYVGSTAPIANQATTVWFRPASPSWGAEGATFLWNAATGKYKLATPDLWNNLLAPSGYVFQSAPDANNIVTPGTSLIAIQRAAPLVTTIVLPSIADQFPKPLQIVDYSTGVANHDITLAPSDTSQIMQRANWHIFSTADQLAGITLKPSPELNAWVITP